MTEDEMKAVFDLRHVRARVMGVFDTKQQKDVPIEDRFLGHAIAFVALAPMDGFDVRASAVIFGEQGTESLRAKDCAQLWATYGKALTDG
ncbi:hypothetical protein X747_12425 [Mesorhizobium sp. LNJC384A00]|uniref:hypothetical protein n=1 Tax=Mesorhizobium sp. LNJC384A00 TaxID=1287268 RepID=UPI0003CF60AB|nr:hypothetical protein [Mesorhizobium sp. LNJC384A00]ESY42554.1 hypothetical protein X747_12425 [Mesorhizobium sp. LNJC384A00]